jgi:hypothetical protein
MKLKVQVLDTPAGKHLVVTDENDVLLPNLISVELTSRVNDIDKVVVTLLLDEDAVRLVGRA